MARIDTLTHFLTDIADALRIKKGTSEQIPASTFDEEINNLMSVNEYFKDELVAADLKTTNNVGGNWAKLVKKLPDFNLPQGKGGEYNLEQLYSDFQGSTIDLTYLAGQKIASMGGVFANCKNLTTIIGLDDLDIVGPYQGTQDGTTGEITYSFRGQCNFARAFENSGISGILDLTSWNAWYMGTTDSMFKGCTNLTSVKIGESMNYGAGNTSQESMFEGCTNLISVVCPEWYKHGVISTKNLFKDCEKLTTPPFLDLGSSMSWLDISYDLKNTSGMFQNCKSLAELVPLGKCGYTFSNVRDASYMFSGCTKLTEIDLQSEPSITRWTELKNASHMFENCYKATSILFSNYSTTISAKLEDMSYMFANCHSLQSLDLSRFKPSDTFSMEETFAGCHNLQTLDISGLDLTKATNYTYAFASVPTGCLIYVKDQSSKDWFTTNFSSYTNVQIKS